MNPLNAVTVYAPATVANVVCGFDVLGFCVKAPYDEFTLSLTNEVGVTIENDDAFNLPTHPEKNVSGVALLHILKAVPSIKGFHLKSKKNIKPGSGIGSSAASAAGAVVAANHLLGNIFSKTELVNFALEGECLASGSKHADNIAPAIFGGVTLIRSNDPLDIISLAYPNLFVSILHPHIEIKTAEARAILPKEIPLKTAIAQWANLGALVAGFEKKDYNIISKSLIDRVAEPYRSNLIPAFAQTKQVALQAGALGGGISGSGPSIFMLSKDEQTATTVLQAMKEVYENTNIPFDAYNTSICNKGTFVV